MTMSKKTFRVTVVVESYQVGHVEVEADNKEMAEEALWTDEVFGNVVWGEYADGGEVVVQSVVPVDLLCN